MTYRSAIIHHFTCRLRIELFFQPQHAKDQRTPVYALPRLSIMPTSPVVVAYRYEPWCPWSSVLSNLRGSTSGATSVFKSSP